jgi:hypothetical protein
LQEREAATAIRATEVSLRQTSLDVMQTTCHDSSRLSDSVGKQPNDACTEALNQTIVTPIEPVADAQPPGEDALPRDENTQPTGENAQPTSESSDVDSVLDRLASAGVLRESNECPQPAIADSNSEPDPSPSRFVAATEDIAPRAPRMTPKQPGGDEEESIESYMERLMQRVRGDADPAPTGAMPTRASQTSVSQTGVSKTATKLTTSSFAAPPAEDIGSTMVSAIMPEGGAESESAPANVAPRRPAPDLTANLSAMRELANSAANAAINQYARSKTSQRAQRRLLGAGLTLAASTVLAYFSWQSGSREGLGGAATGVVMAAYWMLGAARGFIGLKTAIPTPERRKNKTSAEQPAVGN